MIAYVYYLFLWDNLKLYTVNVSIIGFGILLFHDELIFFKSL